MTDPKDWLMGLIEEYYWAMVSEYVVGEAEHTIARKQFREVEDEIARLRRIEEAARDASENAEMHFHQRPSTPMWWVDSRRMAALRAALEDR